MTLAVWFAWKSSPKTEHEATRGEVATAEIAAVRDRLQANPDIDHVTIYDRNDAGELTEVRTK